MATKKMIRGCEFNFYSFQEWKLTPYWGPDGKTFGCYDPDIMEGLKIHICEDVERFIPESLEEIIVHEYVHFLQHKKGSWGDFVPLGIFNAPITKKMKEVYPPDTWVIETEARWIQKRPWLIGW